MTMPTFDPKRFIRMTPEQRVEAIEKLRADIKKASQKSVENAGRDKTD